MCGTSLCASLLCTGLPIAGGKGKKRARFRLRNCAAALRYHTWVRLCGATPARDSQGLSVPRKRIGVQAETLYGSTTFWVLAIGLAPAHVGWSANARHWRWGEGWEPRAASRRQGPALALGASCRLAAPGASPGAPSNAGGRKAGT